MTEPSRQSSFFAIPNPLRRLFAHYPLITYAASELPIRCPDEESRAKHTLYIFSSPTDALRGLPSYNPTCLKWQTFLRLAGFDFETVAASNHASPTGVLPFLLPAASSAAIDAARRPGRNGMGKETETEVIPLHHRTAMPVTTRKLEGFCLSHGSGAGRMRVRDVDGVMMAEVYQSLLDSGIRNAWLHSLYLAPDNTELLSRLYVNSVSKSYVARTGTLHTLRRAAEAEILRSTGMAVIDTKAIYAAADEAIGALSTVLGDDDWFFERKKNPKRRQKASGEIEAKDEKDDSATYGMPSIFDAAVFAYTHLLLDPDMIWQDRKLAELVSQSPVLAKHRERILGICWPELVR